MMDVRTIVVLAGAEPGSVSALRAARAVAATFAAGLVGVGAARLEAPVEAAIPFMDRDTLAVVRQQTRASFAEAENTFRRELDGFGHETVWRQAEASPLDAVLRHAGGADLIVAGRGGGDAGALVMAAGVPVLVTPAEPAPFDARSVMVAWKDTREARRALGDALPFLRRAAAVSLVAVGEKTSAGRDGLDAAVARLARHGVTATAERIEAEAGGVAPALLAAAHRLGAGLIVAGAYGHSRLREWAFGGVTHALLHQSDAFLLLSQ